MDDISEMIGACDVQCHERESNPQSSIDSLHFSNWLTTMSRREPFPRSYKHVGNSREDHLVFDFTNEDKTKSHKMKATLIGQKPNVLHQRRIMSW